MPANTRCGNLAASPTAWIQTYTGRQFWPLAPKAADVCIEDIAHALSQKCRYAGHTHSFYSVAEHSVYVSRHVPPALALWGLLHDASETYLPDVPRPIKASLPGFRDIEARVMRAIMDWFILDAIEPPEVKRVDLAILGDERRYMMKETPHDWQLPEPMLGIVIEGWEPERAEQEFLIRFTDLQDRRRDYA